MTYGSVDDHPYGGVGVVLRVDVVDKAIRHAQASQPTGSTRVILLDPQGHSYTQQKHGAHKIDHVILLCGHYEGLTNASESWTVSIGDYILTGGEIPIWWLLTSSPSYPRIIKARCDNE